MKSRLSRSPRVLVTYKGRRYSVTRRPDLAIGTEVPWCVRVGGGWYRVTTSAAEATDAASRFFVDRLRSESNGVPSLIAGPKYPLLLSVDGVAVAAWPAFAPRRRGAKTYHHPYFGRIATTRGPVWMFQSAGREASECGTTDSQQTVADVKDLAAMWLRSALAAETPGAARS